MASAAVSPQAYTDRKLNSELKVKFQRLHDTLAKQNLSPVIDHLYAGAIISEDDNYQLRHVSNQRERSRELLSILHASQHPLAFVEAQKAMIAEKTYEPILEKLDEVKVGMTEPLSGTGTATSKHATRELNDYLRGIFQKIPNDELHQLTDYLHNLGVDESEDLAMLDDSDLTGIVKPIHRKKLLAAIETERTRQAGSAGMSPSISPATTVTVTEMPKQQPGQVAKNESLRTETNGETEIIGDKHKASANIENTKQGMQQMVPSVVHTLPRAESVRGVTSLYGELFVLRDKDKEQVEVYNTTTTTTTRELYSLVRRLSVPAENGFFWDMTSCKHYRCLYIADYSTNCCVHRVELNGKVTKLSVNKQPSRLSVTSQFTLLVTCWRDSRLIELTTEGKQLREIDLLSDIAHPRHAIQLSNGQFVVSHGDNEDPVHRVCIVDTDGHMTQSYGGSPGSETVGQLNWPSHLAVDKDEFIFVADYYNSRVLLLSPTLSFVCEIVSRDQLKGGPWRLFLDVDSRRLYVTVEGRVVVVQL